MTERVLGPEDLRQFLALHQVEAEILRLESETPTVQAAARAVGTTPERIVKSLLFLVEGRPVFAIACGPDRVDSRALARRFGVGRKRVRLADGETVQRVTGYPIGAVPPFGHRQPLTTLIDRRVLEHDEVYAGGGGIDALVRVSPQDILRLTGAEVLDLRPAEGEA